MARVAEGQLWHSTCLILSIAQSILRALSKVRSCTHVRSKVGCVLVVMDQTECIPNSAASFR